MRRTKIFIAPCFAQDFEFLEAPIRVKSATAQSSFAGAYKLPISCRSKYFWVMYAGSRLIIINGDTMSISRLHPLLVLLLCLSAAPAFSVEEIKAGATTTNDAPMTKAEARDMIKSGNSGTEAVASISSPADGSTIKAMARNKIKYAVHGNDAFHAQLSIDGKKPVYLRKPIGTKKMPKLPAGPHELCVRALDKSHKAVGKASCIKVIAQ